MHSLINRHKEHWTRRPSLRSSITALVVFATSVLCNTYAGVYATQNASNPVTDLVLSNIPVFNVDGLFVYGVFALILFIAALLLAKPQRIPLVLYSLSLFYFIRALFVTLTHLGAYPEQVALDFTNRFILLMFGGNDLFFSGHTGAPFLMALLFWRDKVLRYIFLAWSAFFGVIVLLGHLHYSIDVFAAFFITFGICHLSLWLFAKDYQDFLKSESPS